MKKPAIDPTKTLFPGWLLRSKVSPTKQRVALLERRSHTLKLHQSLDATLSLIQAPAGYGKSTILSNWRDLLLDEGHRVCWLSLGREDNDPLQLLTYIAFSLAEGGLDFEAGNTGLAYNFRELSLRDFLGVIIHIIAEQDSRVVLVLDDFENLESEAVNDIIHPILDYSPDNLHVAIATRDDSKLRISSLETKGQAIRFGANQLKFTPMELNDFLADELDSQTIQRLFKITEGWPVAIQMIRSAISIEGDVERVLCNLTGDTTNIASYLSEEILNNLDPAVQNFLMDISLVDRVDCEFADYLREESDSYTLFYEARVLDTLLLPVDNVETTYRLHPLFREHLYEKLTLTHPVRTKVLHLRAAEWFFERGNLVESVRQCVMAGEPQRSVQFISQSGGVMIWFKEGLKRLRAIIRLLDEETILNNWKIALIQCLLNIKDGKVSQARQLYDAIVAQGEGHNQFSQQSENPTAIPDIVILGMALALYEGKQIPKASYRLLEKIVSETNPDEDAVVGNYGSFLCVANVQRGRFAEARKFGEMAIPAFMSAGSQYGIAYIYFHFGDISFAEGNGEEAAKSYQQGYDLTKKHFNDDQGMKLVANILISELNYELDESQHATSLIKSIPKQLEKNEAWFDIHAAGYTTSAHREFNEHGIEAALAIVDRAVSYANENKLYRLTRLLTFLRIDLLLRAHMILEARAELDHSGIDVEDYKSSSENQFAWRERDAAVQVITRLLIREGDYRQALRLLNYFSKQARTDGHVRARMKYKILQTIAHHRNNDPSAQWVHLDAALELFAKSRFIRSFLDEKDELVDIFEDYLATADEAGRKRPNVEHVMTILNSFHTGSNHDKSEQLLSIREHEVLQQLVHGYSNKIIARKIDVSESTVRFHLRNIFVKLQVHSRLQAVAVARQQNLI